MEKPLSEDDQAPDLVKEESEEEEIDDSFLCCVCLDLLYKPVILACGHISCFWCVHRAMDGIGESHCPICRFSYIHFPSICQLLHFLLLKIYPRAYKRREKQVLEEEKEHDCFSPQLSDNLYSSYTCKELNFQICPSTASTISSEIISNTDSCANGHMPPSIFKQQNLDVSLSENVVTIAGDKCAGSESTKTSAIEGTNNTKSYLKVGSDEVVSVSDTVCLACKELLYHPVALNCGHVYCESCITIPAQEALRCQLCHSPHPKGCPKVCLELDHFLENRFPREYGLRREAVKRQPIQRQLGSPSVCAKQDGKHGAQSSSSPTQSFFSWLGDRGLNVHIGAGCDYCGMYPIVGDRYRCKDCVEEIGFDLCGECYSTKSKLPGRFNQQHTPEHRFEPVHTNLIQSLMLRMASEHSEDGSNVPIMSDDASEDPEDAFAAPTLYDDTSEDPEGGTQVS